MPCRGQYSRAVDNREVVLLTCIREVQRSRSRTGSADRCAHHRTGRTYSERTEASACWVPALLGRARSALIGIGGDQIGRSLAVNWSPTVCLIVLGPIGERKPAHPRPTGGQNGVELELLPLDLPPAQHLGHLICRFGGGETTG